MKIIIAILTTFLLLGFNYSYAEGDPDGCKWTVTEETDQYIMESCGTSNARIRQKSNIEITYIPQKQKLANPIEEYKKIVETPESIETKKSIEQIEKDVKITEKKVKKVIEEKQLEKKKIIEQKVTEEIVDNNLEINLKKKELILKELAEVDKEISKTQTWLRMYELLPSLIVQNEKVKAAELDYEAAVETLKKSYSAYYPQVTITYGSNWEDDRTPSKSNTVGVDSIKNDGKHGIQKSITITRRPSQILRLGIHL